MDSFRARLDLASQDKDFLIPRFISSRSISDARAANYLARFPQDSPQRRLVENVLAWTRYIPHGEFVRALENSFNRFRKAIGTLPFYIYLPLTWFDTEHLCLLYLWDKLRTMNVAGFVTSHTYPARVASVRGGGFTLEISGGSHVLILVDAIYTGRSTFSRIDGVSYNNIGLHSEDNPIHFHVVAPFVSSGGKIILQNPYGLDARQFVTVTSYEQEVIPSYASFDPDYNEFLANRFDLNFTYQMAIYFDHQVAKSHSTFEPIYLSGVVPDEESFGPLLPIMPDSDLKERIHARYFSDLIKAPR